MSYEFYMVRINRKVPKEDYARFRNDIQLKKEAIWDKDARNKIKPPDKILFKRDFERDFGSSESHKNALDDLF